MNTSDSSIHNNEHAESPAENALIICVGNQLMQDEGIGSFTYEYIHDVYDLPDNVRIIDAGCMGLDMLPYVQTYDLIITVDAVDGTDKPAGTVFRFSPEDMARHLGPEASLHDLKLVDLFDAASLLGYEAQGVCYGMQVLDMQPVQYHIGLTAPCAQAIPLLGDCVIGELARFGITVNRKTAE